MWFVTGHERRLAPVVPTDRVPDGPTPRCHGPQALAERRSGRTTGGTASQPRHSRPPAALRTQRMHKACVNNALAGHALRPYDAPRATAPDAGSAGCPVAAPSAPLSDPFRPLTPTPETPTMAHAAFHWDDPFLLEQQLSND